MDTKTFDISGAKAVAEQLRGEILGALAIGRPLTARELYDRCGSAEELATVTFQLGQLQKHGKVEKAGMRPPTVTVRGSRSVPEYRLTAAETPKADEFARESPAELATAIERAWDQLAPPPADTQWPDALENRIARTSAHASDAQDGDEFAASTPAPHYDPDEVAFRGTPPRVEAIYRVNFAARYIAMLDDPEPKIIEAQWIAEMIGAVAGRLEAGRALPPDPEAARLLREAEAILLGVAA